METLEALQSELEFYRQNQSAVEVEIRTLIADNDKLSRQVGALLKEKLQTAQQALTSDGEQGKEVDELRRQVALIAKERDSLYVLWQASQKTIDALETELKTYQSYDNRGNQPTLSENRRDLELKLDTALTDYIKLESKYKTLNSKNSTLENDLRNKEKDIASYKERGKKLEEETEELSKNLEEYKINLIAEKKNNEDFKSQLIIYQKDAFDRVKKETEAKAKVAEALHLFDLVTTQKNEAHKKITEITGELSEVKQVLTKVKQDAEMTYRTELDKIKEKYNEKVADMLTHIRNLDTELIEKGMLLNKTFRENKILRETNESFIKQQKDCLSAVDPKIKLAEDRLEVIFQELVSSEKCNIQLQCEKQCLAIDIQRMQDAHTRETKRRDWEEKLLKTQCEELKIQVLHLQKSLDETHKIVNKMQEMLASRTELSQKMVSTKEEELIELNKHLDNQMELSRKWKFSYLEMTEKLKKRLEGMQKENDELRARLNVPSQENSSSTA